MVVHLSYVFVQTDACICTLCICKQLADLLSDLNSLSPQCAVPQCLCAARVCVCACVCVCVCVCVRVQLAELNHKGFSPCVPCLYVCLQCMCMQLADVDKNGLSPSVPYLKGLRNGDIATSRIKQVCVHAHVCVRVCACVCVRAWVSVGVSAYLHFTCVATSNRLVCLCTTGR